MKRNLNRNRTAGLVGLLVVVGSDIPFEYLLGTSGAVRLLLFVLDFDFCEVERNILSQAIFTT